MQLRKIIIVLAVGLAIFNIVTSFQGDQVTGRIFMFDINIWAYRLIWVAFAIWMITGLFRNSRNAPNN